MRNFFSKIFKNFPKLQVKKNSILRILEVELEWFKEILMGPKIIPKTYKSITNSPSFKAGIQTSDDSTTACITESSMVNGSTTQLVGFSISKVEPVSCIEHTISIN